jgi:predicted MFS family arabinose efflux permease
MCQTPLPRLRVFILSLLILVTALAFNAGLSLHGFDKIFAQSLISRLGLEGRQMQIALENDLRFGKPLDKMLGIDRMAGAAMERQPDIGDIVVDLPDGRALFAVRPELKSNARNWSSVPSAEKDAGGERMTVNSKPHEGWYRLSFELRDRQKVLAGTLSLYVEQKVEKAGVAAVFMQSLKDLGLTVAAAVLVLAGLLFSRFGSQEHGDGHKRILTGLIITLGLAQTVYSFQNARLLNAQYRNLIEIQAETIATFVQQDIDGLLDKGVRLDKLVGITKVFDRILKGNPEVAAIDVQDSSGKVLYATGGQENSRGTLRTKTLGTRIGETVGAVRVFASQSFLDARLQTGLLDALTVAVVSFLFLAEMALFLSSYMKTRLLQAAPKAAQDWGETYGVIRPAAFLFIFAMGLSVSFLPLFMESLYKPMAGLSKDLVLGLPISAEMLFTGLIIVPCGMWLDARDWREPFYTGLVATALGSFLCYKASGPVGLITARAVVGLGYGLTWMAMQHFVFSHTDQDTRAKGFSHLVAGIYAGSLCGTAMGAILADQLGFAPVFLVAMGLTLASGVFTAFCVPRALQAPVKSLTRRMGSLSLRSFFTFLADRDMLTLLGLASIPFSIALVGFMFYFSPLYLRRLNMGQSDIGRVLMVYGLFMVTLAPRVSRLVDKAREKKGFIVACGVSASLGLTLFLVFRGFSAVVGAILCLSLAGSLGFAAQAIYAYNSKIARAMGPGQAMGWFRALERSGQMLGPLVFGQLVAVIGMERGVGLAGAGFLLLTLVFWIVARKETQMGDNDG